MVELMFFLKIGLLIFSVISLIGYSLRKSETKHALQSMNDDQVVRQLTPQEKNILSHFLEEKNLYLDSDDVYLLVGEYSLHGIERSSGTATMHDVIGGVEVLCPFDLKHYIQDFNEALVVRVEKQAVIVVLNGEDLFVAEQRELVRAQQQSEWVNGKVGSITPFEQELVDNSERYSPENVPTFSSRTAEPSPTDSELHVEILGQRDETPEEMQIRIGRGINSFSSILWIVAVILLIVAFAVSTAQAAIVCIIIAVVLILVGFFLFFKKKDYSKEKPGRVNRARGRLTIGVTTAPLESDILVPVLLLGDKIPLNFPEHLAERLDAKMGKIVDVEARVLDNSLVSFDREWNVTEEVQRFKLWYWGRYLLAALTGIFALIIYGVNNDSPYRDLSVVSGYYFNPAQHYTEASTVSDPKLFSLIHLQGNARCEYSEGNEKERGFPVNDCASIRWGGEPSSTEFKSLALDQSILFLLDGRFITYEKKIVRVPNYDRILNGNSYYGYGGYSYGGNNPYKDETHHYILNFAKSLQTVEQACEQGLTSCDVLKTAILKIVSDKITTNPITEWNKLVKHAQSNGALNKFSVVSVSVVESLRDAVSRIVYAEMSAQIRAFANQVLYHQSEGVVVIINDSTNPYGQQSQPLLPHNAKMKSWHDDNIEKYLKFLSTDIQNNQLYPFDFTGIVIGIQYDLSGTPILELDTYNYARIASDALVRLLLLVLGLILSVGFGAMFFIAFLKASTRKRLIKGEGGPQSGQSIIN